MIILVQKCMADGSKRDRHGDALPGALHLKVVRRYFEEFRESGMTRDFAEGV